MKQLGPLRPWLARRPSWAQYLIGVAACALGAAPVVVILAIVGWPMDPITFVVVVVVVPVTILRASRTRAPQNGFPPERP